MILTPHALASSPWHGGLRGAGSISTDARMAANSEQTSARKTAPPHLSCLFVIFPNNADGEVIVVGRISGFVHASHIRCRLGEQGPARQCGRVDQRCTDKNFSATRQCGSIGT